MKYVINETDKLIDLKWGVAPGYGSMIKFAVIDYFGSMYQPGYTIALTVSIDSAEHPKAGIVRLNAYYAAGFTAAKLKWAAEDTQRVSIYMTRPLAYDD